ncbi:MULTISPECIES: hypothetical protein [Mesorhizobium]|uniref:hypothetical protein n=1 Tax=Mesorhizobium sp. TaxID=1871066 RepID=UPI000A9F4DA8|nr:MULTISPECIES: hypothetical protein [Mesorhizobium]RWM68064.1 MAG: hypothetical protein EOR82_25855 [Mesorhizobium sp.]TIO22153.1 MAG: hypothetical protein E5X83_27145 [Mesorhizobium sp.]TJV62015.1 MAG: hypothetical protein E5X82_06595 [Mesorhizobium sp.]
MKLRATRWRGWFRSAACADEATLGRKPTDEEEAKWHAASAGERDALIALCRYPARTVADQVAKGRYLRKFHSWRFGELTIEQTDALLLSMSYARKAVLS